MRDIRRMLVPVVALALFAILPAPALASGEILVVTESPPSGPRMEADEYPASLTGERFDQPDLEGYIDLLKTSGAANAKVRCADAELDGGQYEGPITEFTLGAAYTGCKFGPLPTTVAMNSCHYAFGEFAANGRGGITPQVAIECDGGDEIEMAIFAEGGKKPLCTLKVPAQSLEAEGPYDQEILDAGPVAAYVAGDGMEFTATGSNCSLLTVSQGAHEDGSSESYYQLHG